MASLEQVEMSSLEDRAEDKKEGMKSGSQSIQAAHSKNSDISLFQLFKYADSTDLWLMALGTLGTVADGAATPGTMIIMSNLLNAIGSGPSGNFSATINKVILISFRPLKAIREQRSGILINDYVFVNCAVYFAFSVFVVRCISCCVSWWV